MIRKIMNFLKEERVKPGYVHKPGLEYACEIIKAEQDGYKEGYQHGKSMGYCDGIEEGMIIARGPTGTKGAKK